MSIDPKLNPNKIVDLTQSPPRPDYVDIKPVEYPVWVPPEILEEIRRDAEKAFAPRSLRTLSGLRK